MTEKLEAGDGPLFRNLVLFGRLVRALGMEVTLERTADLLRALELVGMTRKDDFKAAARALYVTRREQLELFDRFFDLFWTSPRDPQARPLDLGQMLEKTARVLPTISALSQPGDALSMPPGPEQTEGLRGWRYSATEVLRRKDFASLNAEEVEQVERLIEHLTWEWNLRRTRRFRADRQGWRLDLRRTIRSSLRSGGETIHFEWTRPRFKPRPLVLLCDISGSMESYSRLLLQFVYGVSRGFRKVESFVFGTRLTRVTQHHRLKDVSRALREMTSSIPDWSAGTRIGEALKRFNSDWARRVLGQGAIVVLISDGWDRGDSRLLAGEMERLRKSCGRLIWLNPLLGSPGYQPLTRGMRAALPFVDDFLPVHNLASLEQLGTLFAKLPSRGPFQARNSEWRQFETPPGAPRA